VGYVGGVVDGVGYNDAMTAGRPKKTLECLPKGWQDEVVALAEVGASDVEIVDYLDISKDLFYRFIEDEPEFSSTIKKAHVKCEVWWQRNGRTNLDGKEFNSTLWYMNMKNRFGWADKQEVKQDVTSGGKQLQSISPHQFVDS